MTSITHHERVHAPIESAFEFALDPENWMRHFPGVSEYDVIEEREDEMVIQIPYRFLWRPMVFEIRLQIVEPNRHIVTEFESRWLWGEAHYYYSEIEEGTLIEAEGEYRMGDSIVLRLMEPLLRVVNRRRFKKAMRNEKQLIEAESST